MYYRPTETGKRIKQLRKASGMTQEQLADKVGVSPRMVRAFESGDSGASIDVLVAVSQLFDTSLDYLILGKPTQIDVKNKLNELVKSLTDMTELL